MYEGVTEYFANLFQINQGLIDETDFLNRMAEKIEQAKNLDDKMPFTTMSANVLKSPYKEQYLNVYQKGALIGMCIDIIIREKSNGERGILNLMQQLSKEYGVEKAFNDDELFSKITALTYPEVGEFLTTYVSGSTPIPYEVFLAKVGVTKVADKKAGNVFLKGQNPYITVDKTTKEILVLPNIDLIDFYKNIDLRGNDIIVSINDKAYTLDNIYEMIGESENWKENDSITIKIKRDGKEQNLSGKVSLPYEVMEGLKATDESKASLKNAWLKG
jgi:predicted metalloprotease with PDZ domain